MTRDDPAAGIAGGQYVERRWHPGIWFAGPRNSEGWAQLRLDAERVRPGGRLHPARGAAAQFGWNPAPWFTRLTIELSGGERVDVEADRLGRGAEGFIEAAVRGSLSGGVPYRIVWAAGNERQGSRCDVEGFGDYYSCAPPAGRPTTPAWRCRSRPGTTCPSCRP